MSSTSGSADGDAPPPAPAARPDAPPLDDATQLAFFGLDAQDAALLQGFRAIAEPTVDGVIHQFYDHLMKFEPLRELLGAPAGRIDRLQGLQRDYFLSLTEARFDEAFFASRDRVGKAHLS